MVMLPARARELDVDISTGQFTQAICLPNIRWQTYQALLHEMGNHRATRVAYDQGVVTLKMPSKLHEFINRLLAYIVRTIAVELDLPCADVGSMTLQREDLEKGAEPDTGFYLKNAPPLEGLGANLLDDLPPDLVIEVDITSPSTQRMGIYQALGVSEIWQYTQRNGVIIHQLSGDGYIESAKSKAFPQLSAVQLNCFVTETENDRQLIQAIRNWAQTLV